MAGRKVVIDVTAAGKLGGEARAASMTTEQLSAAGRNAVKARWDAYYRAHPEKLKAKRERAPRKTAAAARRKKPQR